MAMIRAVQNMRIEIVNMHALCTKKDRKYALRYADKNTYNFI